MFFIFLCSTTYIKIIKIDEIGLGYLPCKICYFSMIAVKLRLECKKKKNEKFKKFTCQLYFLKSCCK